MNGILLLDKPAGLSSNAALQRVKRMLNAKRAGHVGSLDPLATGMLPICLNEATKVAGEILAGRKSYRFCIQLGTRTTTGDAEGAVAQTAAVPEILPAVLAQVLARFRGPGTQVPPMFSALKRQGQPLYKLARAGIEIERAPRMIELFELRSISCQETVLELEVLCSKGTYVRTLAEDIAAALGTVGHVIALRRQYVEPFRQQPMETLEAVAVACQTGVPPSLLPADIALRHLPGVRLDAQGSAKLRHGQALLVGTLEWLPSESEPRAAAGAPGRVRLYGASDEFIGLGELDGRGTVRPRRLFA